MKGYWITFVIREIKVRLYIHSKLVAKKKFKNLTKNGQYCGALRAVMAWLGKYKQPLWKPAGVIADTFCLHTHCDPEVPLLGHFSDFF